MWNSFLESSQCYLGGNSPADLLSDDEEIEGTNHRHSMINHDDSQTSPHSDQTINPSHSRSPSQTGMANGLDDVSTTTPAPIKAENETDFRCSSPLSPPIVPNKISIVNPNLSVSSSSSSNANKRLAGTLNRLLYSAINRPNGHHHQNGFASLSPSASSSTTTQVDSTAKEPKTTLEMSTPSIESESQSSIPSDYIRLILLSSFCSTLR